MLVEGCRHLVDRGSLTSQLDSVVCLVMMLPRIVGTRRLSWRPVITIARKQCKVCPLPSGPTPLHVDHEINVVSYGNKHRRFKAKLQTHVLCRAGKVCRRNLRLESQDQKSEKPNCKMCFV